MKIAGVYKITNIITGEFYIGSSNDVKRRWATHKCPFTWERHPNVKLYKGMASYGLDNFTFEILEETDNLKEREQYWIKQLSPTYNDRHADGIDIERKKESHKRALKTYRQAHRDRYLAKLKDWRKANRDKQLANCKAYNNRLCFYKGETLTLGALSTRLCRQGIANPCKEAKKYLIERSINDELI